MFRAAIILPAFLAAAACQVEQAPDKETANASSEEAETPASPSTNGTPSAVPATPPEPSPSEPAPTPDEAKSPAAAVAVVRRYCDAIARKNYGQAYRLWANKGEASGMNEREFDAELCEI